MRKRVKLTAGRSLWAAYSRAERQNAPWIVYLPESGSGYQTGSRAELGRLLGRGLAARFNYLAINKPGVERRGYDRLAFERSFRRDLRVGDALGAIRAIVPKSAKIYLVGYSEGAYLAPEIALHEPRVVGLALVGGGTRGWLKEELNRPLNRTAMVELRAEVRRIHRAPTSIKKWQGFSYATWHSYRHDRTLEALERLNVPTLAILGARDRMIDLPTTLDDLTELAERKPVHIELLPGCGHSFAGHWMDVSYLLREFLVFTSL